MRRSLSHRDQCTPTVLGTPSDLCSRKKKPSRDFRQATELLHCTDSGSLECLGVEWKGELALPIVAGD